MILATAVANVDVRDVWTLCPLQLTTERNLRQLVNSLEVFLKEKQDLPMKKY